MSAVHLTGLDPASPPQPPKARWIWTSPDSPLRINVPLNMIAKLCADLEQCSSRGEAGGVLLGKFNRTGVTLDINDYALLAPDPSSASEYYLDVAQLEHLRHVPDGPLVVGYFRTQPDGALHLRRPEINLVTNHFNHPSDVVLLIRTSPRQFRAGFLFWDGDAFVPFSVRDFPFDPASLAHYDADERRTEERRTEEQRSEGRPEERRTLPPLLGKPFPTAVAPMEFEKAPWKPSNLRRNVLVAAIGIAALIGLSLLLPREDVALVSKPADPKAADAKAADSSSTPAPEPVNPAAKPATPAPAGPAQASPAGKRAPVPVSPGAHPAPAPAPPKLTVPTKPATSQPAPAPLSKSPGLTPNAKPNPVATPPLKPQPSAFVLAAERTPAAPAPVLLSPPPTLSTREQPPAIAVNPPAVTAPAPAPPAPKEEVVARTAPAPRPAAELANPSRFAGAWVYPMNNGLYHGSEPEIVDVTIQETNGHLSGTAYARFRAPNEPARTLRFQFAGDVRAGRTQVFSLETVDGVKGSLELIPGTSPNLLELNFRTTPEGGNAQSGNMILVRK